MTEKRALGRGLAALIPQRTDGAKDSASGADSQPKDAGSPRGEAAGIEKWLYKGKEVIYLTIDEIIPNRFQPRIDFRDDKLKELAESIKQQGVLQPVLVKRLEQGGFELLAGERRWRAVKALGLDKIPAIIKDTKDSDSLQISLIENLHRDDLNPMEEARAYKKLMDEFGFDLGRVSQVVGKASSSVSNMLRLLTLPEKVQNAILSGLISTGHAKAILALKDTASQERLCQRIVKRGLSVREAERISSGKQNLSRATKETPKKDSEAIALEDQLQRLLGTKVKIGAAKRGGKIIIDYFSNEDLERIVDIITGSSRQR